MSITFFNTFFKKLLKILVDGMARFLHLPFCKILSAIRASPETVAYAGKYYGHGVQYYGRPRSGSGGVAPGRRSIFENLEKIPKKIANIVLV